MNKEKIFDSVLDDYYDDNIDHWTQVEWNKFFALQILEITGPIVSLLPSLQIMLEHMIENNERVYQMLEEMNNRLHKMR